ncbi:MAG: xylulokinase [Anaerolineae bacterium]|nr:xylulokinase [Anaerolineae bacterium]
MPYLLGIDIGTSSVKAVLFDPETARITATAAHEYPIHKPTPDRAEQNPDDWWDATVMVVRQVMTNLKPESVVGIGFSGQMHGTVLVDAAGKPVHPAIIWADQRSGAECAELVAMVGAENYASTAGTLPAVGFMGATLLWLRKHQPDLLEKAHQVLLPKDYVRLKMTGNMLTDSSDAAGTGIFDVTKRAWADEIIRRTGLPESLFPVVIESGGLAGHLQPEAAALMGLPAGIRVAAGCADQPAQALGNGLITPGKASVTTGSGGQVFIPLQPSGERVPTDPRLHVFNHAVPGMYYVLGAILSAGLSLRWLRNLVGLEGVPDAYPRLSAEAAQVAPGADGLIFLPYLSGERTPHMDSLARGAFIGLSAHHTRGHLARAVMEGVAFALRQTLEISRELGADAETIIAAGGGAESDVWRQIQADVFGVPLQQTLLTEQAGVGAALLGGMAAGVYAELAEACSRTVRYGSITQPNTTRQTFYNDRYAHFLELYPRLKGDFHRLANHP